MLCDGRSVVGRRAACALLPVSDRNGTVYSRGRIRGCARQPMPTLADPDIVRL
jgi:hypothetical protein